MNSTSGGLGLGAALGGVLGAVPSSTTGASSAPAAAGAPAPAPSSTASAPSTPPNEALSSSQSEPERIAEAITQLTDQYQRLVPESHVLVTDLHNTLVRIYRTFDQQHLAATEEGVVMLAQAFHPTADEATIKSAMPAAYREACG